MASRIIKFLFFERLTLNITIKACILTIQATLANIFQTISIQLHNSSLCKSFDMHLTSSFHRLLNHLETVFFNWSYKISNWILKGHNWTYLTELSFLQKPLRAPGDPREKQLFGLTFVPRHKLDKR